MSESSGTRDDRRVTTDERDLHSFLIRSRFDDPAERRSHARGELVRVAPRRYVESAAWRGLRREERHALRTVAAVGRMRDEVVVSHTSAAAVWGMPVLGPPLARVLTTDPARARTHTGAHVTRHAARTRTIWRDLARPQRIVTRLERAGVPRVHTANRARHRDWSRCRARDAVRCVAAG
jgi:hypothetical protein